MDIILQLGVWVVILAAAPVCGAVWALSRRYRDGRIAGGWRVAYRLLCVLAAWYVTMVAMAFLGGWTVAATLLSVLWAIGVLSWLAIAAGDARQAAADAGGPAAVHAEAATPDDDAFAAAMQRRRRAHAASTRSI